MKKVLLICLVFALAICIMSCNRHQHDENGKYVIVKEATCIEDGRANLVCECGEVLSSIIISKTDAHKVVIIPAESPTCNSTGLTQGKMCAVCNIVLQSRFEIPMIAHTYDNKHDVDCNECGHIRNPECTHSGIEILEAKEPTCDMIGLTEGKYCPGCDEIIESQEVIDSLGHEMGEWFIYADDEHPEGIGVRKCIRDNCGLTEHHEVSTGLEYSANGNGECTIVGLGTCMDEDIFIPASIDGYTVTRIGYWVMKTGRGEQIKNVVIPNTVTYIEPYAFGDCYLMERIYIPSSVTNIGEFAFAYCYSLESIDVDPDNQMYKSIDGNLYTKDGTVLIQYAAGKREKSFDMPDEVLTVCPGAFSHCYFMENIVLSENLKHIGSEAFAYCDSLKSIDIPASVEIIDLRAFVGSWSLENIEVDKNNENYMSIDGNLYSKDGKILMQYATGKTEKNFTIPDGVETIADCAFLYANSLTEVTIPDSVVHIGHLAFHNCLNLTNVYISDSVEFIGESAFSACWWLESIEVDVNNQKYKSIDGNLYTKDGTVLIQYGTAKKDKSFVIPNGVVRIANEAFMGNEHLVSVTIPNSVCDIGWYAFEGCTSLTNIVLPDSLTEIKDGVFARCESLTSINIPHSVTSIGWDAFYGCKSLQTIVIPNSVQYIWEYAFEGCDSLTIYCEHEEEPPHWNDWEWNPDNRPVVWGY